MTPTEFKQSNCTYGKNQKAYMTLPAHQANTGVVTSCWKASWKERLRILFTGRVFVAQMTFGQPLQPVRISLEFKDYNRLVGKTGIKFGHGTGKTN